MSATRQVELITFKEAFHGRTLGTISASNQEKMHKGFLPSCRASNMSISVIWRR
jgi:acetylornithine/succinyldiaminopimelate/putrescine aminotransferase